jgi:GntR family transcriptional regulator
VTKTVNKDLKRPIYLQLQDKVRQQIEAGELKPGDRVPSELELAAAHKISRMTARRALNSLVEEGLLVRQPGKGTFVAEPKMPFPGATLSSFSGTLRVLGLAVTSKITNLEIVPASLSVARNLNLPPQQPVVFLRRLRYIDNIPMALMSSYMHESYYQALQNADLSSRPITQIMEEASGLQLVASHDSVEASLAEPEEADLLGIRKGMPVLLVRGIVYEASGMPVRMSKVVYRGDRFRLLFPESRADSQVKLPDRYPILGVHPDQWLTLSFALEE